MKPGLIAPVYLALSWVLTVSYQLFTETSVRAVSNTISLWWPAAGGWLSTNVETIAFIYAFTWIFVLSSVIPSVILGKNRSVLIQYVMVLALTLIAFFIADILQAVSGIQIEHIFLAAALLENPVLAGLYLAVPYIIMITLDFLTRRKMKEEKQKESTKSASENIQKQEDKLADSTPPKNDFLGTFQFK